MKYSNSLFSQLSVLLTTLGFGFLMGAIYEVVFCLRTFISNSRKAIIAGDLIFCIICTVMTFLYMLVYCEGSFRYNYFLGEVAGIVLFHFTFGRMIERASDKVSGCLRKIIKTILSPLERLFSFLKRKLISVFHKIFGKIKKNSGFRRKKS